MLLNASASSARVCSCCKGESGAAAPIHLDTIIKQAEKSNTDPKEVAKWILDDLRQNGLLK